jgi:hypothetical protein
VLYPTELRGHIVFSVIRFTCSALPPTLFVTHTRSKVNKKSTRRLRDVSNRICSRTNRMRYRIFNPVPEKNIFDAHELERRVNSKSTAFKVEKGKSNQWAIQTRIPFAVVSAIIGSATSWEANSREKQARSWQE